MGMTTNEAIEAIKCNWPDSRYTILREALGMAISALRQQEHFRDLTKKVEPLTNAQKIRSMSDEELAEFLWDFNLADVSTVKMGEFGPHMFRYRLKEWLQQPAEEDDHDERKENENA